MIHVARSALWVGHYTETRVEYSYYLPQIQLHDPTVKVPCLINHRKQSTNVVWTTLLEVYCLHHPYLEIQIGMKFAIFLWWTDNNLLLNMLIIFIFNSIYFGIPKQMEEAREILCDVLTEGSTYSFSSSIIIHPWAVISLMMQTTSTT